MAVTGLPRFPLAALPTPLVRAERLEKALGSPPLYVKRDDLCGFGVAGNKARKLEFVLGDALARGCDTLVTGGGPSSNHVAAAAAGARVAGLRCLLVLYGSPDGAPSTNLALARAFGAEVRFTGDPARESVDDVLPGAAAALEADGRRPAVVPRGGASATGAVGYALAAREIAGQLPGGEAEAVVLATGSCGTQAGLVAASPPWRIIGAAVSRPPGEGAATVLALARGCAALIGAPPPAEAGIEVVDAVGPGFGLPSEEGEAAARLAAGTEGLLCDPVYTAKAFAVFVEVARRAAGPVVFLHTGGLAGALEAVRA